MFSSIRNNEREQLYFGYGFTTTAEAILDHEKKIPMKKRP